MYEIRRPPGQNFFCSLSPSCFVTQSSLKRLFHVTRVMSSEREFRSGLSQFPRRNEVKQGHKVQKINCRPDYILERIDVWCRF